MRRWILAFLFSLPGAYACSCGQLTACQIAEAPVVFIGKVVAGGVESLRDDPWYKDAGFVRFEVVEAFRGMERGTRLVEIKTHLIPGMCAPNPYRIGRTYLVTPGSHQGTLIDGSCFSGRDMEYAKDTVEQLRSHLKDPSRYTIRGVAGATARRDLVDYLIGTGEAKPLAGVRVSTTVGNRSFTTTTDSRGRYELAVPGPGRYELQAHFAPYDPVRTEVNISAGGACAHWEPAFQSRSSISGVVRDHQGGPIPKVSVGLIDADKAPAQLRANAEFRTEYSGSDGRFNFQNVPLGRYVLVFNAQGPRAGQYRPVPYEATFYPNGAARAAAETIVIDKPELHLEGKNLLVGPPVEFRSVSVSVRFSDGTPMTTALVEIFGEPSDPNELTWHASSVQLQKQADVRFQVPANRRLRITVRDWHGRDLVKKYESTHAPGLAPITTAFTIQLP